MGISRCLGINLIGIFLTKKPNSYVRDNFVIAQKEELKSLIYQWLDEHPISKLKDLGDSSTTEKPMSRAEIAEYLSISTVTVTDWMKKGCPTNACRGGSIS